MFLQPNLVDVAARVKALVERVGSLDAAARRTGVPATTLSRIARGQNDPTLSNLARFAQGMGVSVEWLLFGRDDAPQSGVVLVPVMDITASCGPGSIATDVRAAETFLFPEQWIRRLGGNPRRIEALRASGDSMEPLIADGALLMIDRSQVEPPAQSRSRAKPAQDLFVFLHGNELRLKRVRKIDVGCYALIGDNGAYAPEIAFTRDRAINVKGRLIWWDNRL
jgi:transcriptional regulator with XRE-family HTH domain